MKSKSFIFAALIGAATFLTAGFAQQSAEQLYQSGLYKEDVEGKLEEAIAIYQEIVKKFPQNSPVAAKALFHMGLCYEKLGQEKVILAQDAFQKVIEAYHNQTETVQLAKEKLSSYIKAASALAQEKKELKTTKIYTGGDYIDSISPDEKKLAVVRDDEIWVRDVATGKEIQMTKNGNSDWNTLWSPDGKWIAWVDSDRNVGVIDVEKATSHTLISPSPELDKTEAITPTSWTPGSDKIIFQVTSKGLYAVSPTGVEWEEVFVFDDPAEAKKHESMTLSPDGRWIAYMAKQNGNNDVYIMSSKGDKPIRITPNPAEDRAPRWSYDGKWLAFASYGTENPQLWVLGISSEGKPVGSPIQVTKEAYILGGNWTKSRNIGFPVAFRTQHIFVANSDGSGETQLTQFPCGNYAPRWSPDGKTIAFRSDYRKSINTFRLWSVPSQGGEPKLVFRDRVGGYVWSPNGEKIILYDSKEPNQSILSEIPAAGGEPKEWMRLDGEIGRLDWSPDGKSLLYSYVLRPLKLSNSGEYLRERLSGINIISADGREPRTIIPAEKKGLWYSDCKWSPDGRKIAFIVFDNAKYGKEDMYSIWTMDADGGGRKLITDGGEYNLCWSPDGKYIVYESRIKGMDFEIYRVPSEGGIPEKINILGRSLEYSPDGKRIAYSRWLGGGYEFWLSENFIPKEKTIR